jgi:DNA-binding PadR family transcriptional regulator
MKNDDNDQDERRPRERRRDGHRERDRRGDRGHRPGSRGRGRARGRASRGDVRAAVLLLLEDEPMHGYQLMQAIAERTDGRWSPSPGAIYPALRQLEDEGLVDVATESGRKLVTITDAGRGHADERREEWGDPFAADAGSESGPDLRPLMEQLHAAVRQVARAGNDEQRSAAATTLTDARRTIYLILAGEEPTAS